MWYRMHTVPRSQYPGFASRSHRPIRIILSLVYCPYMLRRLERSWAASARHWPPRNGPLTLLFAVFRPSIVPPLVVLIALLPWRYARDMRLILVAITTFAFRRRMIERGQHRIDSSGRHRFSVMSWNILFENRQFDALLQFLATTPAEIVALQELTAEHVARIQQDTVLACR